MAGMSWTIGMLNLFSSDAGPMPECMRILGESRDPAHRMTSFEARTG